MSERVSQREAARRIGIALSTLQHHIKAGTITIGDDGLIDPELASAQYSRGVNRDQSSRARGVVEALKEERRAVAVLEQRARERSHDSPHRPDAPSKESDAENYLEARTRREAALAQMAEVELAEKLGEMVRADDAKKAAFALARAARDALLGLPPRLAPMVAAESDPAKVAIMIDAEVRRVCEQIANGAEQLAGGAE